MKVLSCFSGIGAHDLGLQWAGMEIIGQCECDPYCLKVLEKHWPGLPRFRDIRNVTRADVIRECGRLPDLITGGFPCQDISCAGKGEGLEGKRSGLFFELARVIDEIRPAWLLLENVPALRTRGYDRIHDVLDCSGYALWASVVGAKHAGAPHSRKRVWIVGHTMRERHIESASVQSCVNKEWHAATSEQSRNTKPNEAFANGGELADTSLSRCKTSGYIGNEQKQPVFGSSSSKLANANDGGGEQDSESSKLRSGRTEQPSSHSRNAGPCKINEVPLWPARPNEKQHEWEAPRVIATESDVGGAVNGAALRVARLTAVGNCNPPQLLYAVGRAIMQTNFFNRSNHASKPERSGCGEGD